MQQAKRDEQDRRQPADARICWKHADQEGGAAHHHDGDEKGVFAADQVTDTAKDHRAEGAHKEARRVGGEGGQQCRRSIFSREEQRGEERRQHRVEIEVVPFENRAERGCEDDEFFVLRHAAGACRGLHHRCHVRCPYVDCLFLVFWSLKFGTATRMIAKSRPATEIRRELWRVSTSEVLRRRSQYQLLSILIKTKNLTRLGPGTNCKTVQIKVLSSSSTLISQLAACSTTNRPASFCRRKV